jgi:oligopeptidase A
LLKDLVEDSWPDPELIASMTNILLQTHELPPFSRINIDDIEPALDTLLAQNRERIAQLTEGREPATWSSFVDVMEEIDDVLGQMWSPVSHLNGVQNSDALRAVIEKCLPKFSEYSTEMGQNPDLFARYKQLRDGDEYKKLTAAQRKVVDNAIRDFKLSGIDLPTEQKKRYGEITKRLSELSNKFSNNVLDATQGWHKHFASSDLLPGLPATALNSAAGAAKSKGLEGFVITLDFPLYFPLMTYCDDRGLREEFYTAYVTRASELGPNAGKWDNSALMLEILALRNELAKLLGFNSYAERSLATKMATSTDQVVSFLRDLAKKSKQVAQQDFEELQQFAKEQHGLAQLQPWDVSYYSEKLRQARYSISDEELRPYFPVAHAISGMFAIVNKLYGIEFREASGFETYHPDVKLYEIVKNGNIIARFYFDLFARDGKRGGAWMADCRIRRRKADGKLQLPVAYLTCNFMTPTDTQPSLLSHNDVTTLFHEFGHGLHHMLTQIDVASVSGINGVEWDAVELPSQFMENWCWEKEAIPLISKHYQTGESLPDALLEKMLAAKNFQSGMQMLRQLEFALFDFLLHMQPAPKDVADVQKLLDEVRKEIAVVPVAPFNRFQHGFTHIFAGGYAAGYYSYKWAEVLSADAFSAFEENGIFDRATGEKFLSTVLSQGGAHDAMQHFVAFRGREPKVDALLRHSGIAA